MKTGQQLIKKKKKGHEPSAGRTILLHSKRKNSSFQVSGLVFSGKSRSCKFFAGIPSCLWNSLPSTKEEKELYSSVQTLFPLQLCIHNSWVHMYTLLVPLNYQSPENVYSYKSYLKEQTWNLSGSNKVRITHSHLL